MKILKSLFVITLVMVLFVSSGCANTPQTPAPTDTIVPTIPAEPTAAQEAAPTISSEPTVNPASEEIPQEAAVQEQIPEPETTGRDKLVIYFSRTGEQYTVGVIEKGNTSIVAEMIAEIADADLFEVLPVDDHYPMTYNALTDVAKQEQNANARPEYAGSLPDLSQYETIFIGAPVWWADWPMIMYTVFENNDFTGKKLVPFSTHEGSGLSGFDRKLAAACPNSEVLKGLAIRGNDCQNQQDAVHQTVEAWLAEF